MIVAKVNPLYDGDGFLARFVDDRLESYNYIELVAKDEAVVLTTIGFTEIGQTKAAIYSDLLTTVIRFSEWIYSCLEYGEDFNSVLGALPHADVQANLGFRIM